MKDSDLQQAYERVLAERAARGETHDVSLDELQSVSEGRGTDVERAAVIDRLLRTREGRQELDLVRAATQAAGHSARRRFHVPLAIAATLVIGVVGGVLATNRGGPDDRVRGSGSAQVILQSPPLEVAPATPIIFSWSTVAGARAYEIELVDDAGDVVLRRELADTTLALPGDIALTPGRPYLWRVTARAEAGDKASDARRLLIRPR